MTQARLRSDRSAWAFALLAAASVPVLVAAGRARWFWLDEWDMILERDLGDPGSLLRPWWGHNVTIPSVLYRGLLDTFGMGSYRPFLLAAIAGHLAAVAAVWAVTRALGVRGWVATAAVAPLLVLGAGRTNILWGFQITMTLSLAFGLVHLLLADRDGPWARRDTWAVLCGLAGLMCSSVAVATVVGVGAATLVRRGRRVAVLHTVPLGLAYAAWYVLSEHDYGTSPSVGGDSVRFAVDITSKTFGGIAQHPVPAILLGALFLFGVVPVLRTMPDRVARMTPPVPLALGVAVAAVTFMGLVAIQRVDIVIDGVAVVEARYVYVLACLVAPTVALGIDRLAGRRPAFAVAALAALLVGVPGNVALLDEEIDALAVFGALFTSTHLDDADGTLPVMNLDVATVREFRDEGIVDPPPATAQQQLTADALILVRPTPVDEPPGCTAMPRATVVIGPDEPAYVRGDVDFELVDGDARSLPLRLRNLEGARELRAGTPVEVAIEGRRGGVVLDC